MDFRRRAPRHPAGWIGLCQIQDEPEDEFRECRVLDISELGLGIVLHHPLGVGLLGRHISVESPTAGASVTIKLEGEVRYAIPVDDDAVRLGLRFFGLTELEKTVVKALGALSPVR
jgi:PilZ domain